MRDEDGDTPILVCEEPEIFEYLIGQGANGKDVNNANETIFDKAVQEENEIMISYLISNSYISNDEMKAIIEKHNIEFKMMDENEAVDDDDDVDGDNDDEEKNNIENDKKRRFD